MYPTAMLEKDIGVFWDPHDIGELAEPLRSRIYTIVHDAPDNGLELVSGARSPWQQFLIRRDRVPRGQEFNPAYSGYPVTAVPYRSDHQKRKAADMGGRAMWWFIRYASRYGLLHNVSSEDWHVVAVGQPTVRIIPYPGSSPSHPQEMFTVSQFEVLKDKMDAILGGLMTMQAQQNVDHERLEDTTERVRLMKEWTEVSTKRTRRIQAHLGIPDND